MNAKTAENIATYAAVAIGGGAGAICRLGILNAIESTACALLVCNVAASALMGAASVFAKIPPKLRAGINAGFCGGLSVFSGLAKDADIALFQGEIPRMILVWTANFALSVAAAALGKFSGRRALETGGLWTR